MRNKNKKQNDKSAKMETTLTIEGRGYTVTEQKIEGVDRVQYILTGKRGAIYGTMRMQKQPEVMFLMNANNFLSNAPKVYLTDKNGVLEIFETDLRPY